MAKWGNPILQGIIDGFEKQRVKAVQDATRTQSRRPQSGGRDPRAEYRMMKLMGDRADVRAMPSLDELFLATIRRQQEESQMRAESSIRRDEAAHPEFYKGRKSRADYKKAWAWEIP